MTAVCTVTSLAPSLEPENHTARKLPLVNSTMEAACTACPGVLETNCAFSMKCPSAERCAGLGAGAGGELAGSGERAEASGNCFGDCFGNCSGSCASTTKLAAGKREKVFHPASAKASTSIAAARYSKIPTGLNFKRPPCALLTSPCCHLNS